MKKLLVLLLVLFIGFSVFAEVTGIAVVDGAIKTVADKKIETLTTIDWIIAGAVCCFVELVIKKIFKDGDKYKWIWRLSPLALSVVVELIITLINKGVWYNGIILGVQVGAIAVTYYDVIFKAFKTSASDGIKNTGEAVKQAVEKSNK